MPRPDHRILAGRIEIRSSYFFLNPDYSVLEGCWDYGTDYPEPLEYAGRTTATALLKQNGFLIIPDIAPPHDLDAVRVTLDALFEQTARDHGVLDHALDRAPQLKHSLVFQSCERIAKELLGPAAAVSFDQALYKPPHEDIGTRWHQDQAFQGKYRPMNSVHFWIPLQPVTEQNGCLHFIPGSHLLGLLPHYQCQGNDTYSLTLTIFLLVSLCHVHSNWAVPRAIYR